MKLLLAMICTSSCRYIRNLEELQQDEVQVVDKLCSMRINHKLFLFFFMIIVFFRGAP